MVRFLPCRTNTVCVFRRLTGTGDSSFIYCSQPTAATATPFSMPLTHYYSLRLTSKLSAKACGANFLPKGLADRCEGANSRGFVLQLYEDICTMRAC